MVSRRIDKVHIIHTRWTGGHARQARQAPVYMFHHIRGGRTAFFQHLLHQIDPPAWRVEFITKQNISRAGGSAESAMNAGPQHSIGVSNFWVRELFRREMGLHGSDAFIHATGVEFRLRVKRQLHPRCEGSQCWRLRLKHIDALPEFIWACKQSCMPFCKC